MLTAGIAGTGDAAGETGQVLAAFTGGSLLNGSTGRTDLLGAEHKLALTKAQFGSARRLASELPDDVPVCPTHGFGSFCSATPTSGAVDDRRREAGQPGADQHRGRVRPRAAGGPGRVPGVLRADGAREPGRPGRARSVPSAPAEAGELRRRIDAGEWVVDLRSHTAFAAGHLRGALNFELADSLATYLGWLIPWGTPLTLIGENAEAVATAQRDLCRIGIDAIEAAADGPPAVWAAGERARDIPDSGLRRAGGSR